MQIYLKNNAAKFQPDPIWNNRALGFWLQQEREDDITQLWGMCIIGKEEEEQDE